MELYIAIDIYKTRTEQIEEIKLHRCNIWIVLHHSAYFTKLTI